MRTEVVVLPNTRLVWRMDRPFPTHEIRGPRGYSSRSVEMDPFPAYAHDVQLVRELLVSIAKRWPIGRPCRLTVLDRESTGRMNGECEISHNYRRGKLPYPWAASIVLYGKRIPPMPSKTRYLVVHEYGHAVEAAIARKLGDKDGTNLRRAYGAMRRIPKRLSDGGPTWHRSAGEVFANDFRILIGKAEPEFWPHTDVAHPLESTAAKRFWKKHARGIG